MPNPHFDDAMCALGDPRNSPEAAATLALAYQAETANLLAYINAAASRSLRYDPSENVLKSVQASIEERLGLS